MSSRSRLTTPEARHILTEVGTSPITPSESLGLPDDLLQQASQRLGIMCLIMAFLWGANLFLAHVLQPAPTVMPDIAILRLFDFLAAVEIVTSLGLFWYIQRTQRNPRFLLTLGLIYELLIAFSIGILDWHLTPPAGTPWIAIIILIFAAIVPSTPRTTLLTALAAASMDPLAALIWKAIGQEVPAMGQVFLFAFPNYLCAAVAPLISHVIIGLGREVRKAREMGSYVLGDLIGSGGMGEVWQATHRFLVRPAAIKLIRPEVLSAVTKTQAGVLVERFRREARAAANLHSPHTIQLYDFGIAPDGTFYYVMELLNGLDLQTLVSKYGPMPANRVIFLLQQACESLAEAHGRGLVHRDIKPANIQVCRMGHYFDFVKVLDFGLVKTAGAADLDRGLTSPNTVTGTPAYISPESAIGEAVDHRSDIYSLGCVAYWMLTGRSVFTAERSMQIIARHLQATPAPPSQYSAFPIPAMLEETVLACLMKRPEDRPASARDLCDRLSRCSVEPWTREDAERWWERRMEPERRVMLEV